MRQRWIRLVHFVPVVLICLSGVRVACAQDIAEGMGIRTDSPLARDCRHGVMEFLLINHPLDCPICDQAGECQLQEFSVQYGTAGSRFHEEKVKKPKGVALGPRVTRLPDPRISGGLEPSSRVRCQ